MKRRSLVRRTSWSLVVPAAGAFGIALVACGDAAGPRPGNSQGSTSAQAAVSTPVGIATAPAWATKAAYVGRPAASDQIALHVYLQLRNSVEAAAEAAELNDPTSASFGKFLSAEEFHSKYSPAAEDVAAVRSWAEKQNLAVEATADDGMYIRVSGATRDVESAFQTRFALYQVGGKTLRAPETSVTMPQEIAGKVLTVRGLHDKPTGMRPAIIRGTRGMVPGKSTAAVAASAPAVSSNKVYRAPPPPGFRVPPGCTPSYGRKVDDTDPPFGPLGDKQVVNQCPFEPPQLRTLYDLDLPVDSGLDGKGVTVAIVDAYAASKFLLSDAQEYARRHDPTHPLKSKQFKSVVSPIQPGDPGTDSDIQGWYEEQALDVEAFHAMAPGADIVYVGTNGPLHDDAAAATLDWIIDHDLATIISNSWYEAEDDPTADRSPFAAVALEANLRGVGVYFCTGDFGDNSLITPDGLPIASFPASLPGFTAVGGTSVASTSEGRPIYQVAWQEAGGGLDPAADGEPAAWDPPYPGTFFGGGGGGPSAFYAQPSYQKGIVPARFSTYGSSTHRATPDVALLGSPDVGMNVGLTQQFPDGTYYDESSSGGTSLSAPLFVGIMAIAEQAKGSRVGFANPALYRFHDFLVKDITPRVEPPWVETAYNDGTDDDEGTYKVAILPDSEQQTLRTASGYDSTTGLGTPSSLDIIAFYGFERFEDGWPRH